MVQLLLQQATSSSHAVDNDLDLSPTQSTKAEDAWPADTGPARRAKMAARTSTGSQGSLEEAEPEASSNKGEDESRL